MQKKIAIIKLYIINIMHYIYILCFHSYITKWDMTKNDLCKIKNFKKLQFQITKYLQILNYSNIKGDIKTLHD